ncbi:MAG: precorrin-4 C(11)-methyltransferase [Clostridia bacterium]|nr:precorrin-4 C(11)-methyltransferase [Clostridia bacterium]
MIHFVGAGPGAVDLITLRGKQLIEAADVIIYAGSLVNPALLNWKKEGCALHDSARMTLEQVVAVMRRAAAEGKLVVRLHTGDPSIYGAIREQMDVLEKLEISYEVCPGVSSFCGAAAALKMEYTLPGVSQSVILTRMAGRTPVPERESVRAFAAHGTTMILFLSAGLLPALRAELIEGGYPPDTPAAIVCRASWPDEQTCLCTVDTLPETAVQHNITKTALILVGEAVRQSGYQRSKLYDPTFETGYRPASAAPEGET